MSVTKRKCLKDLEFGSAQYVVEHARWRESRGKKPSLSFLEEFNPRKALGVAIKEAGSYEIQAKFWLNNIRGNDPLLNSFESFKKYALKSGKPLSHFGVSERDLEDLKLRFYEIQANFWLNNLKGDNPLSPSLEYFKKYASASARPLSYFGVSEKDLEKLKRRYNEITANFWLNNLKGDNPLSPSLEYFKKHASASGRPLSHFGVSEKELEELSRKI